MSSRQICGEHWFEFRVHTYTLITNTYNIHTLSITHNSMHDMCLTWVPSFCSHLRHHSLHRRPMCVCVCVCVCMCVFVLCKPKKICIQILRCVTIYNIRMYIYLCMFIYIYVHITGASTCSGSLCAVGKYGPVGSNSSEAATCAPCPAGTYSATNGLCLHSTLSLAPGHLFESLYHSSCLHLRRLCTFCRACA